MLSSILQDFYQQAHQVNWKLGLEYLIINVFSGSSTRDRNPTVVKFAKKSLWPNAILTTTCGNTRTPGRGPSSASSATRPTSERPSWSSTWDLTSEFRWEDVCWAHYNIFRGIKPFVCNECGLQFTVKSNWQRHVAEHSGNRFVECGQKCWMRIYILLFAETMSVLIVTRSSPGATIWLIISR